jgi:hypothetical protein
LMGTVLTNPFELNFGGLASRNAENVIFNADPTDEDGDGTADTWVRGDETYEVVSGSRRSMNCNAMTARDVFIVKRTHANPGNPIHPYPRYEVWAILPGPRWFIEGDKINDKHGVTNCTGCRRPNYIYNSRVSSGEYTSLQDAEDSRDDYIFEMNVFRTEAGCTDSKALNYSAGATSNPCPCENQRPVWTQGQNQTNNPQLQQITEKAGDCSCLMPPTNLDGQGYLVEKWEFVGTPYPNEYDPNPPYSQLTNQWKWKRNTSKSNLPQPNEDNNLYAIAKEGWRATGLNTPQEFIVKRSLAPNTWVKYRLITATGFEKMGCMDNTAMNYDSEAQVQPQIPQAQDWSEEFEAAARLATKYECKYCTDSDENATIYNQETEKCECIDGYTLKAGLLGSKCKKGVAKSGKKNQNAKDDEDEEGMSMGMLMAGIAGLTVVGLGVLTLSGGPKDE